MKLMIMKVRIDAPDGWTDAQYDEACDLLSEVDPAELIKLAARSVAQQASDGDRRVYVEAVAANLTYTNEEGWL